MTKLPTTDTVVIGYERPRGVPSMQEMLYPTNHLKSIDLDDKCALIIDGSQFS